MIQVELLAPAGSREALDAAIGEGADAVYLGLKDFNARMRSANFTYSQFEEALRGVHSMGRKLYVTVNTVFEQREADRVYQLLKYLSGLGPDGILVQDFGIITMARDNFPSLKLHASTQMNIASARGVNLLSKHGFSRVVLARELSLNEIREIRANTNMELEVFVHGALCMSVSGLCLFSSYLGGKSANRGMCTQACRRLYYSQRANTSSFAGDEDSGGYYFSPADLQLIDELPALAGAGVNSFKIEGRMKSAEYVGTVVSAYRLVMDHLEAGEESLRKAIAKARSILRNDFARTKTKYLINAAGISANVGIDWLNPKQNGGTGISANAGIDWLNPKQNGGTGISLGRLLRVKGRGEKSVGLLDTGSSGGALIALAAGDSVRLHKADDSDRVSHKLKLAESDSSAGAGKNQTWISIPEGFSPGDMVYLIQTKSMTKRYPPVIRKEGNSKGPGRAKAPAGNYEKENKLLKGKSPGKQAELAPGMYVMVSRVEDLYILQSARPKKAILPCTPDIARHLLNKNSESGLPFKAADIILSTEPFFPQGKDNELSALIPLLVEKSYSRFILNNPGHFSLFRGEAKKALLIAGPWLYTFNSWSRDFILKSGSVYCVSPLENNRQNLEKTFPDEAPLFTRWRVFITVYSRPSLFRIRTFPGSFYNFENFSDNKDEAFRLAHGPEGSLVFPSQPFSIVDKIPFLKEAGFGKFILDFSDHPLKKAEYRETMEAVNKSLHIEGTSRFNWKNGFYSA